MEFEKNLTGYLSAPTRDEAKSDELAAAMSKDPKLDTILGRIYKQALDDAKTPEERKEVHERIQYLVSKRFGAADFLAHSNRVEHDQGEK